MENREETAVEEPVCNLCGSAQSHVVYEPRRIPDDLSAHFSASQGIAGAQRIVRCSQCGLVFASPRLRGDAVLAAYAESVDEAYVSQSSARLRTFETCLACLHRHVCPPGQLLDVGAAAGFFLKAASAAGWQAVGVEPSRWLAEWGIRNCGVDIRVGTIASPRFPALTFDAVTMWDSLEHMPDPIAGLSEAARILRPGGFLVVNTPNFGSLLARAAGRHWWFLLSHHLYYFTPGTLRTALEKVGFEVVAVEPHVQRLELGHLAGMLSLYSKPVARRVTGLFRALHCTRVSVPYYAAQMNVIAKRKA